MSSTPRLFDAHLSSRLAPWRSVRGGTFYGALLVVSVALASGCESCEDSTGPGPGADIETGDGLDMTSDVDGTPSDDGDADAPGDAPGDGTDGDADATCDGVPCGERSQLCCTGSEICVNELCQTPGKTCDSNAECPDGKYCEPTLGKCLPESDDAEKCTFKPPPGQFQPEREGAFPDVQANGDTYNRSIAAPTAADVDDDGRPEVVVQLYRGALSGGLIAVYNGRSQNLVDYGAVENVQPNTAGIAVGQLDPSTPQLEIVAPKAGGGLVALKLGQNGDLSTWWTADAGNLSSVATESAPSIADLDGDGTPEVIHGFSVVDNTGSIWNGLNEGPAGGQRGAQGLTSVVDLDQPTGANGNRDLEIVAGNRAMTIDGSMLWDVSDAISDGFTAVGDFGDDGTPEVVTVTSGDVYILDGQTGSVEFGPKSIAGGGQGGPPTIADFDDDGFPEFSAAGQGQYTVYDLGCGGPGAAQNQCDSGRTDGILWTTSVQDLSSSRTGSSVFDFEADGQAEVVYNDECFLRVFNGKNGNVLYERANTSRTGSEYPIVVDVDADNNSEIVVASNNDQIDRDGCEDNFQNYPQGGTTGIFVYADAKDRWVPTRSIWNQHTYHVTNVRKDGTIPKQESIHYRQSLTNTFRLNVQRDGRLNAPDLIVTDVTGTCTRDGLAIEVTVANDGSIGVGPGLPVAVFTGTPGSLSRWKTLKTTRPLRPGARETLSATWPDPPRGGTTDWKVRAVADSDEMENSTERECEEMNNRATASGEACPCLTVGRTCTEDGDCCSGVCASGGGDERKCVGN